MCSFEAMLPKFQNCLQNNKTKFVISFTDFAWDMAIWTFLMGEVCVLPDRFISSSKGTCILSFYIILPNFIKIGQELFEIIDIKTHRHTHRQTDRHNDADENNTCPKTKFLGQVIMSEECSSTKAIDLKLTKNAWVTKSNLYVKF